MPRMQPLTDEEIDAAACRLAGESTGDFAAGAYWAIGEIEGATPAPAQPEPKGTSPEREVTTPGQSHQPEPMGEPVAWEIAVSEVLPDGELTKSRERADLAKRLGYGLEPLFRHPPAASTPAVPEPSPGAEGDVTSAQAVNAWNKLMEVTAGVFDETECNEVMRWVRTYAQFQYEAGLAAGAAAPDEGEVRRKALEEAAAECDELTWAIDIAGKRYKRPASADYCASRIRQLAAATPASPTTAEENP